MKSTLKEKHSGEIGDNYLKRAKTTKQVKNQMNSRTMNNLIMWNNKKIAIITLFRIKVRNKTHWTITQL